MERKSVTKMFSGRTTTHGQRSEVREYRTVSQWCEEMEELGVPVDITDVSRRSKSLSSNCTCKIDLLKLSLCWHIHLPKNVALRVLTWLFHSQVFRYL